MVTIESPTYIKFKINAGIPAGSSMRPWKRPGKIRFSPRRHLLKFKKVNIQVIKEEANKIIIKMALSTREVKFEFIRESKLIPNLVRKKFPDTTSEVHTASGATPSKRRTDKGGLDLIE